MENKLNESEDNKEEGEKGGKKEEVGDKRSPILGRQKKRFAKDDNKNNNNNNNNNNKSTHLGATPFEHWWNKGSSLYQVLCQHHSKNSWRLNFDFVFMKQQ